jgi:YesN/AraC family two-component response regulator
MLIKSNIKALRLFVILVLFGTSLSAKEYSFKKEPFIKKIDSILNNDSVISKLKIIEPLINASRRKGDYVSTVIAINKTFEYYKDKDIDEKQKKNYNLLKLYLGQAYIGLGLYSKSIKSNTEVLLYAGKTKDTVLMISSSMILSEAYTESQESKKGKEYMFKALELSRLSTTYKRKKIVLGNIAAMFLDLDKPDSAMVYLNKLENMEKNEKTMETYVYLNKCDCLLRQGKIDSALVYCNLFKKEINKFSNEHLSLTLNVSFAEIYLALKNSEKAEFYTKEALKIAMKKKYIKDIPEIYKIFIKVYNLNGNQEKTTFYQNEYLKVKDSLISINMKNAISNIQMLYDIEKDKMEISKLKTKDKIKQIKLTVLMISLVLSLLVGFLIYFQKREINKAYKKIVEENIRSIDHHDEFIKFRKQIAKNKKIENEDSSEKMIIKPEQANELEALIRKAFDHDEVFLNNNLDLGSFASMLGTNKLYLSYVFNNVMNISFSEMLNNYRINKAKKLLLLNNKKFTIESIALESGFSNKATFNRNFKNITGITPSIFIKIALDGTENVL